MVRNREEDLEVTAPQDLRKFHIRMPTWMWTFLAMFAGSIFAGGWHLIDLAGKEYVAGNTQHLATKVEMAEVRKEGKETNGIVTQNQGTLAHNKDVILRTDKRVSSVEKHIKDVLIALSIINNNNLKANAGRRETIKGMEAHGGG